MIFPSDGHSERLRGGGKRMRRRVHSAVTMTTTISTETTTTTKTATTTAGRHTCTAHGRYAKTVVGRPKTYPGRAGGAPRVRYFGIDHRPSAIYPGTVESLARHARRVLQTRPGRCRPVRGRRRLSGGGREDATTQMQPLPPPPRKRGLLAQTSYKDDRGLNDKSRLENGTRGFVLSPFDEIHNAARVN